MRDIGWLAAGESVYLFAHNRNISHRVRYPLWQHLTVEGYIEAGSFSNEMGCLMWVWVGWAEYGCLGWVGHSENEHSQSLFMDRFTVDGGFGCVGHSENGIGLVGMGVHCFGCRSGFLGIWCCESDWDRFKAVFWFCGFWRP